MVIIFKFLIIYPLLFIFFCCTSCVFRTDPGEGSKVGKIVKVSKQGMIRKTWECTLIRGGLNDGSGSFGNSFEFTIEDVSLALEAIKYMEEGADVIIFYKMECISSIFRSEMDQPNFCTSIVKR